MNRRVVTEADLLGKAACDIAPRITKLLKKAREAQGLAIRDVLGELVEFRYELVLMTENMQEADPRFDWQLKRLQLVKELLHDRLDVLQSEAVFRAIAYRDWSDKQR